jgi:phosphotransferase system  glucose/maltose/N-acetylglucosamine-specific IIC component
MSLLLLIVALIVAAILLGVAYFIVSVLLAQNYWKERNVYTLRTRVPILGHMANMFNRNMSFPDVVLVNDFDCYSKTNKIK